MAILRDEVALYRPADVPFAVDAPAPPLETSHHLKLKSHVLTPSNPAFNNLYLDSYHIAPAYDYAVSTQNLPKLPVSSDTSTKLPPTSQTILATYFSILAALSISMASSMTRRTQHTTILINAGNGTQGVFIDQGVINYDDPVSGGFLDELYPRDREEEIGGVKEVARTNTLLYGPVVQLFYKPQVNTLPVRCSDGKLVAEYC